MSIWTPEQEAENLRLLFKGVKNKAAFAKQFKVPGGPSMLSQQCSGNRPINLAAATAYATGFGVSIDRISPRLAKELEEANKAEVTATPAPPSIKALGPNPLMEAKSEIPFSTELRLVLESLKDAELSRAENVLRSHLGMAQLPIAPANAKRA